MIATTDFDLVEAIRNGSEKAMETIFDRHSVAIYSIAMRVFNDGTAAEDVLCSVLLQLWRVPDDFSSSGLTLTVWLSLASRNVAVASMKKASKISGRPQDASMAPSTVCDSRSTTLSHEEVIALAFVAGMNLSELCDLTREAPATVKRKLAHATSAIRLRNVTEDTRVPSNHLREEQCENAEGRTSHFFTAAEPS